MESQTTAFVMLGLLYLACTLVEVHSVKYTGDTLVKDGQPWNITCSEVPINATIKWKLNGQPLEDLASGIMHVEPAKDQDGYKVSTLVTTKALERHEGSYACVDGNETHHLAINYDVTIKVLSKNESQIVLDCPPSSVGDKFVWTKEKKPLPKTPLLMEDPSGSLAVNFTMERDEQSTVFGNYSCKVGNLTADYRVVKRPIVTLPSDEAVGEGGTLHLTCVVKVGDPGLKLIWNIDGKNYTTSGDRVKLSKDEHGMNNAVLAFENVKLEDRGNVSCKGYYNSGDNNPLHYHESKTYVRVKGKFAALWPFLGICAEVIVLCVIILVYEKKRNKSELEESDTDQSPDSKPTPNKDSDVRQRK